MTNNQEFRNYLAAGIVCQSLWPGVEERTPVAYSYNGVVLPKLPESEYQYATLALYKNGDVSNYIIVYTPYRPYRDNILGVLNAPSGANEQVNIQYWMNADTETEWGEAKTNSSMLGAFWGTTLWANYDVLNTDGTVYLEASEPIPVYE